MEAEIVVCVITTLAMHNIRSEINDYLGKRSLVISLTNLACLKNGELNEGDRIWSEVKQKGVQKLRRIVTKIMRRNIPFKIAWVSLTLIGVAILGFGLILTMWPGSSNPSLYRAIGVASIGMSLFGVMITVFAYRRGERWAWFILWYYPVFWSAHFLGGLPPGQDHIHQIVFIILSLAGLLIPIREFFPRRTARRADTQG